MNLGKKFADTVEGVLWHKAPAFRLKFTAISERRMISLQEKKTEKDADFGKKYRSIVLPYWKKFGIKPYKKAYRVLCPKGKEMDPRYIPNDMWQEKILCHFNDFLQYRCLADKALQGMFVSELEQPEIVAKVTHGVKYDAVFYPLADKELCQKCREAEEVIIKIANSSFGGSGISFLSAKNLSDEEIMQKLAEISGDYIIQKVIRQHPLMNKINASSINTMRIVTFYYKGQVHMLSAVLRMGSGDARVDNITQGGFACRIHEDGRLDQYAVSRKSSWNTKHPGGVVFEEVVIPGFEKIVAQVKAAAMRVPYFKILGWDIALGENGQPVFIEFNVRPEQNQKTCGPTFGDMTDEVLEEVFRKKK